MAVLFDYLPEFEHRAKDLAKKYKSFAQDYLVLLDELENNPFGGQSLGNHVYKYRMAISSKGKGKVVVPGLLPIICKKKEVVISLSH